MAPARCLRMATSNAGLRNLTIGKEAAREAKDGRIADLKREADMLGAKHPYEERSADDP